MFALVNGKPNFYIGKINGIGYIDNKEREEIIKQLKKENKDIEIIDEEVIIDEEFKKKAIDLGEKQLTYSKSKFTELLNSGRIDIDINMIDLQLGTITKQAQLQEVVLLEMIDVIFNGTAKLEEKNKELEYD